MRVLKVRNKNAMKELLLGGVDFDKISIVSGLEQDDLTKEVLSIAKRKGVRIETTSIQKMAKRRSGHTKEVLLGFVKVNNVVALKTLLDDIYSKDEGPFFLLINKVDFESNIGVIARTAFAAGVNGIIFQGDEKNFLNDETLHFSIGAIMRIPLVKMGIFEALKELQKNGIKTFCLQMDVNTYYEEGLSGPAAFVLGAEAAGVSDKVINRCAKQISIPMKQGIDSLNVGISAGIVLYEKIRQDKIG